MTSLPVSASTARTTPDTVLLPTVSPCTSPTPFTTATLSLLMEKRMLDCGWGPPSEVTWSRRNGRVRQPLPPASPGSVLRGRGRQHPEHSTCSGLMPSEGGHAWSQGRGRVRRVAWVPTCIVAPMISVTFLGINLNGGKTCVWRQREKGDRCILSICWRASFTLNTFRERETRCKDITPA